MIIVKDIPETISVNVNSKQLVLPWAIKWAKNNKLASEAQEPLEDIKNTPVSGVVINKVISSGTVEVYDPRGFTCQIVNFEELVENVDISRGVIQEDLWYGLGNTKKESWILLTSEMKNQSKKAIQSIRKLKPGYVYKLYYNKTSLVYLGRAKWKDCDGILKSRHTFANPETREITYFSRCESSYFEDLGYDASDIYHEAINALLTSYQGSAEVKVSQIFLQPDLKYRTYHHSLLMPEEYKEIPMWSQSGRDVVFVKQVSDESIRVVLLTSRASRRLRYPAYPKPGWDSGGFDKTEYDIELDDVLISVKNGEVERTDRPQYLCDLDFDLNSVELLKSIVNDPSYKCLLCTDDKSMRIGSYYLRYSGMGILFDCLLTNGEKKSYFSIIKNSIKF